MGPNTFKRTASVLAASLLAACAHLQLSYQPGEPLAATLPMEAAGIRDRRAEFAAVFSRQLRREGREGDASHWLHNVPAGDGASDAPAHVPPGTSVLVIPGIFGDCVADQSLPYSDGVPRAVPRNYTEGYGQYGHLGLASLRAVPVAGRASSETNSALVADAIEAEARQPGVKAIVLLAYSKGLPDTLVAIDGLAARGRLPRQLKALVSVSGVLLGTPIADRHQALYDRLAASFAPFGCSRSAGGEVESLTRRQRLPWLAAHPVPEGIKLYSIVAHADRASIAPGLRPFHDELGDLDPRNDGQVIAGWSILPRSSLLAEARSDHWTYVLAIARHPNPVIRSMAAPADFPREAFFSAVMLSVARDLGP